MTQSKDRPVGITMGCPVGIGPEIILHYFATRSQDRSPPSVVLGDINVLRHYAQHLGIPIDCVTWNPGLPLPVDKLPVYPLSSLQVDCLRWGKPDEKTGQAMANYIEKGVELIQDNALIGLATGPITKLALQKAGYHYPGHTEMLAALTGSTNYSMMMAGSRLRVTLVTIHCSLKEGISKLTRERIVQHITLTQTSLINDFGIAKPRIGVAALNPHASENGLFGREEEEIIGPAIEASRALGLDVTGPHPPDTIFYHAVKGTYDAVVCMYHDQGLIPFKLLHFEDGVNVTLGLPIVRTSVDHGTAYDIAGQGLAHCDSLAAAVELAASIYHNRQK